MRVAAAILIFLAIFFGTRFVPNLVWAFLGLFLAVAILLWAASRIKIGDEELHSLQTNHAQFNDIGNLAKFGWRAWLLATTFWALYWCVPFIWSGHADGFFVWMFMGAWFFLFGTPLLAALMFGITLGAIKLFKKAGANEVA